MTVIAYRKRAANLVPCRYCLIPLPRPQALAMLAGAHGRPNPTESWTATDGLHLRSMGSIYIFKKEKALWSLRMMQGLVVILFVSTNLISWDLTN